MLAYKNRFHGHKSLGYVYRNAAAVRSRSLTLKSVSNPRRHTPRIAVVVSRKISKRSTIRNRIRRRIYEWFRLELPRLKPQSDIVCIVTSIEVLADDYQELSAQLATLARRAGLYKTDE